jgi:hypothetical protein
MDYTTPENTQFQALAATLFDVLKALESEVVAYKAAEKSLLLHHDGGVAYDVFQRALESARQSQHTRKAAGKYAAALAEFQGLSRTPIGPNMQMLQEWLMAFRSGMFVFFLQMILR